MSLAYTSLSIPLPSPTHADFPKWAVGLLSSRLSPLTSPSSRATTYYVDPSGSDSNDGLAEGNAFASLTKVHDVLTASSGDVRFLFKRGGVFRDRGKEFVWEAGDGGHDAAIYVTKDNVTFGMYGTGDAPRFICSDDQVATGATWTESATSGVYYTDVSGFTAGTIDAILEVGNELARIYSREASIAACATPTVWKQPALNSDGTPSATAYAFFHDTGNDRLYVYANGSSPSGTAYDCIRQNHLSCFRVDQGADDVVFAWGEDGNEVEGFGFGLDNADTNSHDYFISIGCTGTNACYLQHTRAYYGSAHCIATWNTSAGTPAGGIVVMYNVGGGLNQPTSGERVVNFYQPGGGQEAYIIGTVDCYRSLDGGTIEHVGGHTAGSDVGLFVAWDVNDPAMNNLPGGDIDARRGFTFFGSNTTPPVNYNFVRISPAYDIDIPSSGFATTSNSSGFLINAHLDLDGSASSLSRGGMVNSSSAASDQATWLHPLISMRGKTGGAGGSGTGLNFDVLSTAGVTSGVTVKGGIFQRISGIRPCVPGIGDNSTQQVDNAYYDIDTSTVNNQAGYASSSNPVDLSAAVTFGNEVTDADLIGHATKLVDYDHYFRPRSSSTAAGPIESGAIPSGGTPSTRIQPLTRNLDAKEIAGVIATASTGGGLLRRGNLSGIIGTPLAGKF